MSKLHPERRSDAQRPVTYVMTMGRGVSLTRLAKNAYKQNIH